MTQAAIPNYMKAHLDLQDIAPGHQFGLYFPIWQDDWRKADGGKTEALKKATSIPNNLKKLAENLQKRQRAIALETPHLAYFPAKSTSPFMTGIGNEHPLENGFAFLNPYGLPYLPGSSVKGVLRTAAEELALGLYGETAGWDMLAVWWLFGFEAGNVAISKKPYKGDAILVEEAQRRQAAYQMWIAEGSYDLQSLHAMIESTVSDKSQQAKYKNAQELFLSTLSDDISLQGALSFWDVYPQSKGLAMDILTPHHMGYFQGKNAPHDSEQPNPNVFLTIPPGSSFDFYCNCELVRLPQSLQENWQALINAAFEHAFDWLGFGAKTAVGYGQMRRDENGEQKFHDEKEQRLQKARADAEQQEAENRLADLPPFERDIAQLLKDKKDPNKKDYLVLLDAVKTGQWQGTDKQSVLERIQSLMQQAGDWRPTTQKKDPSKDKEYVRTQDVLKLMEQ
jgi:CRISPR-associated protein Cmr6